jgi:hypothetical protein
MSMPICFSYIGDPDAPPFQWEPEDERYRTGNLPKRILPAAGADLGVTAWDLARLAKEGVYEGSQIDWGAWAVKMTGNQIRTFFANSAVEQNLLADLEPERIYLLVAAEGP